MFYKQNTTNECLSKLKYFSHCCYCLRYHYSVVFSFQETVPFVFVGTVESIANAKLLLEFHIDHLKVKIDCCQIILL